MTFETSIIFFITLILLWLKPGPGQALRLAYALQAGFWGAFMISLGVTTVCIGYFLFAALGYNIISNLSALFFTILKVIGASYFIYLGLKGLYKRYRMKSNASPSLPTKQNFYKDYGLGVLMASSNPIPIFYFIGILPTLVPLNAMTFGDLMIGVSLIAIVGIVVDGLLLLLTVLSKEAFVKGNTSKYISLLTSFSFVLIGLYLLYSAIFLQTGVEYSFD